MIVVVILVHLLTELTARSVRLYSLCAESNLSSSPFLFQFSFLGNIIWAWKNFSMSTKYVYRVFSTIQAPVNQKPQQPSICIAITELLQHVLVIQKQIIIIINYSYIPIMEVTGKGRACKALQRPKMFQITSTCAELLYFLQVSLQKQHKTYFYTLNKTWQPNSGPNYIYLSLRILYCQYRYFNHGQIWGSTMVFVQV